jgi:PPE-repeat protein
MSMMDAGALPPEINSGLMYAGAGSGPMVAAEAAWEGLAAELSSAAMSYRAVVSELTGEAWLGPSSMSMAASATSYIAWMNATAAQAEHTASQLGLAVAAYDAAFAATVPPPVIAANRALLASLVATNIVGQNTSAIAATEAQYAEMWAQDAAAMYGYAGASAAATTLTPFTSPTQSTNPTAAATQASAVTSTTGASTGTTQSPLSQLLSQVPSTLQSLASAPSQGTASILDNPLITDFENLSSELSGYNSFYSAAVLAGSATLFISNPAIDTAMTKGLAAAAVSATAASPVGAAPDVGLGSVAGSYESGGAGVSAGLGRAASVGGLSVPRSWGTASPAIRLAATALPAAGLDALPEAGAAGLGGSFGGLPMMGSVVNAPRAGTADPRSETRPRVTAAEGARQLSERDELNEVRRAIAELAKERDVLMRSAALLIKEAMGR